MTCAKLDVNPLRGLKIGEVKFCCLPIYSIAAAAVLRVITDIVHRKMVKLKKMVRYTARDNHVGICSPSSRYVGLPVAIWHVLPVVGHGDAMFESDRLFYEPFVWCFLFQNAFNPINSKTVIYLCRIFITWTSFNFYYVVLCGWINAYNYFLCILSLVQKFRGLKTYSLKSSVWNSCLNHHLAQQAY